MMAYYRQYVEENHNLQRDQLHQSASDVDESSLVRTQSIDGRDVAGTPTRTMFSACITFLDLRIQSKHTQRYNCQSITKNAL